MKGLLLCGPGLFGVLQPWRFGLVWGKQQFAPVLSFACGCGEWLVTVLFLLFQ